MLLSICPPCFFPVLCLSSYFCSVLVSRYDTTIINLYQKVKLWKIREYFFIFGIALIILLVLWYIWTANNLIAKRNRVKQCRSGICVALKQRNDMIPNLVAAVKSYMGHENETLTRIAELRSRTFQPSQETEQIRTGNELSSLISKLQLSVEDYPELKASEQFTRLQRSIEDMELQLQAIRRTYNAAVTDYNNSIEMFPSSIVAGRQNHHQEELIDIPEQEQRNVDVSALLK